MFGLTDEAMEQLGKSKTAEPPCLRVTVADEGRFQLRPDEPAKGDRLFEIGKELFRLNVVMDRPTADALSGKVLSYDSANGAYSLLPAPPSAASVYWATPAAIGG